jgi:hypothetical protein
MDLRLHSRSSPEIKGNNMSFKHKLLFALLAAGTAGSALAADAIPYPARGAHNPNYIKLVATASGPLSAYFLGSDAKYTEVLSVSINGKGYTGPNVSNKSLAYGQKLDFGNVKVGDVVWVNISIPEINVSVSSQKVVYAPGAALSNAVYVTSFSGDKSASIPAGTYVGFEDQSYLWQGSDWDYNDSEYVFTNLTPSLEK